MYYIIMYYKLYNINFSVGHKVDVDIDWVDNVIVDCTGFEKALVGVL